MTRPPSILEQRLGRDNAQRLAAIVGGTRLSVPGDPRNAGTLVRLLGNDLAALMMFHFPHCQFRVPMSMDGPGGAHRRIDDSKVRQLTAKGWSAARIARHLGCSERGIEGRRAKMRRDGE